MPEEEKQKRMVLELMSGSRFRLPFLVMITIDDPADLITLLGLDGRATPMVTMSGMDFSLTPNSKMDITLNAPGKLTIEAAIKMHDQHFVRHLLWQSTKVPGDVRWVRRLEMAHYQERDITLITSDYQSLQGWGFDSVPPYTLERMKIDETKYTRAIEKALESGIITEDQLSKAIEEVEKE